MTVDCRRSSGAPAGHLPSTLTKQPPSWNALLLSSLLRGFSVWQVSMCKSIEQPLPGQPSGEPDAHTHDTHTLTHAHTQAHTGTHTGTYRHTHTHTHRHSPHHDNHKERPPPGARAPTAHPPAAAAAAAAACAAPWPPAGTAGKLGSLTARAAGARPLRRGCGGAACCPGRLYTGALACAAGAATAVAAVAADAGPACCAGGTWSQGPHPSSVACCPSCAWAGGEIHNQGGHMWSGCVPHAACCGRHSQLLLGRGQGCPDTQHGSLAALPGISVRS